MRKDMDRKSVNSDASLDIKALQKSSVQSFSDNQFATRLNSRRSTSVGAVAHSLVDLQTATADFATARLVGEGTIGRVYKAKYGDGKVIIINSILLWLRT